MTRAKATDLNQLESIPVQSSVPFESTPALLNTYVVRGDGYPVQPGQDARSLTADQRRAWMVQIETKHKRKESATAQAFGDGGGLSLSRG